jgi:hypothetical protein
MKTTCACGCGKRRGLHRHHVVYQQKIREVVAGERAAGTVLREATLVADRRNIVMLGFNCHAAHHGRQRVLPLRALPGSAYEFAAELLGAGEAYEYLRRRYSGEDWRLDALLREAA